MSRSLAHEDFHHLRSLHAAFAGCSASFVGIGLARFAYTPLIPPLIENHWLSAAAAGYIGAANLVGYLAGAWLAPNFARPVGAPAVLRGMMLLAVLSFFACAIPLSVPWLLAWRFASGLAGGVLMALAAPTILPHVEAARRGLVGGIVFAGVGLGVVVSGTLVPLLLRIGLVETWSAFGAVSFVLAILSWTGWPHPRAQTSPGRHGVSCRRAAARRALSVVNLEYALNAAALVPHMIFLVDFIVRGLGRDLTAGAWHWMLFGIGAIVGPLVLGPTGARLGYRLTLRVSLLLECLAIGLPALDSGPAALALSSLAVGAFVTGIVPIVLGCVHELVVDEATRRLGWSRATVAFAIGQAAAGYGFSLLFARFAAERWAYQMLFALAAAVVLVAFAIDLLFATMRSPDRRGAT